MKSYNPLLWMVSRIFFVPNFTCSHIPGQRGESIFLDSDDFAHLTVLLIRDPNLYNSETSYLNRQIVYSLRLAQADFMNSYCTIRINIV